MVWVWILDPDHYSSDGNFHFAPKKPDDNVGHGRGLSSAAVVDDTGARFVWGPNVLLEDYQLARIRIAGDGKRDSAEILMPIRRRQPTNNWIVVSGCCGKMRD